MDDNIPPRRISRVPDREELFRAIRAFPFGQKIVFLVLAFACIVSTLIILWQINDRFMVIVAAPGGTINEGLIGSPRFINPLLAISDSDRDMTTLLYSGLMRADAHGKLIPDLARTYTINESGTEYLFTLKENLRWSDGTPLTADDIIFTITKAKDPSFKSVKRAAWEGVAVEKISDTEIRFTLKQSYAGFLENTTLGILPKHLWSNITSNDFSLNILNTESIGSGPYIIKDIKRDDVGIARLYTLKPNPHFALGEPMIKTLSIYFYTNEESRLQAYRNREIDTMSAVDPKIAAELSEGGAEVLRVPLPRVYGVFFNQNQSPALTDKSVRLALSAVIDRQALLEKVLHGYGIPIDSPLPSTILGTTTHQVATSSDRARAETLLDNAGWKVGDDGIRSKKSGTKTVPLTLTLATANIPELTQAAELIHDEWKKIGVRVEVKVYEIGDLNSNVIRPRKYEALLFGEVLGRDPDPFSFWHSSQRLDPGLNVAEYTNTRADKILEKARATIDREERQSLYLDFDELVRSEAPAAFVYSPYFLYVTSSHVQGINLPLIANPAERFLGVHRWYVNTDHIWKLFANTDHIITTKQ